jgi:hypothetical protein
LQPVDNLPLRIHHPSCFRGYCNPKRQRVKWGKA